MSVEEFEQAILHPSRVFNHEPANVLKKKEFTREQKIRILKTWAYDEEEMSVAEEENMPSGEDRGHIIDKIHEALQELGAESHSQSQTKHG